MVDPDPDEIKEAAKAGTPLPEPEKVITGSWDPEDIVHVLPFDEAGQVEMEGDEADDEEPPAPVNVRALAGKKK